MILQEEGETRIQYLMRVLEQYMHDWNGAIYYDDATCDGRCLAGDINDELDALGLLEETMTTIATWTVELNCTDEQIKQLAVKRGFKLSNETGDDLKPYVYEFARELIALAQQVNPLDWVFLDHYQTWISRGFDYDYIIPDAGDCYHLHYGDDVLCSSNSIDGLKEAANEDYQRRVLSCLVHGGV